MPTMNFALLQCRNADEAKTKTGTRKGYAQLTFVDDLDEDPRYYDLRGLSSHHQKFRNWCKRTFPNRLFTVEIGGG